MKSRLSWHKIDIAGASILGVCLQAEEGCSSDQKRWTARSVESVDRKRFMLPRCRKTRLSGPR